MNIKSKIIGITTLVICTTICWSQSSLSGGAKLKLAQADEWYSKLLFNKAIEIYKSVFEKYSEEQILALKIADSYRMLSLQDSAANWYAKALYLNKFPMHDYELFYAQSLAASGKLKEAKKWLKIYSESEKSDMRAEKYLKSINEIESFYKDSMYYTVKNLSLNTSKSEFSPAFFKNGIVFVSDRDRSRFPSYDLYNSRINHKAELTKPKRLDNLLNTRYNEGPLSFFNNGQSVVLTMSNLSNINENEKENVVKLGLFFSDNKNGKWSDPSAFAYNSRSYSVCHPAMNKEGNFLIFVSDMPGGYGGFDVYYSKFQNGLWMWPRNIGSHINTRGDELFPFLYNDTTLYFSSDGHGGLGGLDIYKASIFTDDNALVNPGFPVNSKFDDFGYIQLKSEKWGYFSSNRKGDDDIYRLDIHKITVLGVLVDENTNKPMQGAIVQRVIHNDTLKTNSDDKGKFMITTKGNDNCAISIFTKENKLLAEQELHIRSNDTIVFMAINENKEIQNVNEELLVKEVIPPKEEDKIEEPSYTYKVQIGASRRPMKRKDLRARGYKGNMNVTYYNENKWHKYAIGEYLNFGDAVKLKNTCNVDDAFIVIFQDGEKVATEFTYLADKSNEEE